MEGPKSNSVPILRITADTSLKYLQVFNGILELTSRELEVLSKFIDLSETVDLCSQSNKKLVADSMDIKDPNTLNNYVKRLKDKGAIRVGKNGYELSPILQQKPRVLIEINEK